MSQITVPCSGCGQKYALKDSHVGKRVRCKKCETVFLVEDPNAAPEPEVDVYGFDESPVNDWAAPSAGASKSSFDEEDDLPAVHRPKRPKASTGRKRSSGGNDEAIPPAAKLALMIFAGGGLVGLLLMQVVQLPGMIIFLTCMVGTIVVAFFGAIWVQVEAFRTGVLNGILSLFVPFYLLGLIIKYWDEMRRPFLTTLLSYGLLMIFAFGTVFLKPQGGNAGPPAGGPAFGMPVQAQAVPPVDPGFGFEPGAPAIAPPAFPSPIVAGPAGGPQFGPGGPQFGPGGPQFGPGGPRFGPGGPEGPGDVAFGPAFGGPNPAGDGVVDPPGMLVGPGPDNSPRSGPSSLAPLQAHRTAMIGVSTAASQASTALARLASRAEDPSSWTRLQEATDQLRRGIEEYQALPPLSADDREQLRHQQGIMVSGMLQHLSTLTDRARENASRSPQASLIEEPRTLLTEFAGSLGLSLDR